MTHPIKNVRKQMQNIYVKLRKITNLFVVYHLYHTISEVLLMMCDYIYLSCEDRLQMIRYVAHEDSPGADA